ncbi:MAG: succinate dehydrogenase iron-sulfur subunit [Polyangiaceae bacterium]
MASKNKAAAPVEEPAESSAAATSTTVPPPAHRPDSNAPTSKIRLKVLRQDGREAKSTKRWEIFEVPTGPLTTVHACLAHVNEHPVTTDGKVTTPIAFESSCLEEACGACTVLVDGKARQACSAVIGAVAPKGGTITIAPLSKFPLVRDLIVDRARLAADARHVKAWVALDGAQERGPAPREAASAQLERASLASCIGCGACLEACPQVHERGSFIGPAAINQARLTNLHSLGSLGANERVEILMGDGGVAECGKAQACIEACPKDVPLVDSIGAMSRATTKQWLFGWLRSR